MPHKLEKKDNKAIFNITVPKEQVENAMKETAVKMSETSSIPGFRAGKAPYETVKQRVGEMKLLEESLEFILRTAFAKAMIEEDLATVGQPNFNVEKMAPDNDLIFTVEIALYPNITTLADYKSLKIETKDITPSKEDIEKAKKELTAMQTKEIRAEKGYELKKGDKAVLSLSMKKDGVVLEGGEAQNNGVYTAEEHYIPGFVDQIIGLKEDEKKTFTLPFPKDHYQKHLSGKDIDFEVELKEVFNLETPNVDDEFAKSLGLKDLSDLEVKLKENLQKENDREEKSRLEKQALDLLVKNSTFETIPDLLVNQEIEKMVHELSHNLKSQGLELEKYLEQIGKTLAEIKIDFTKNAIIRIKVGLLINEITEKEAIKVEEKELDSELDKIAERYKEDKEAQKRVYEPQYRDYIENQLKTLKAVNFILETMQKK